MVMSLLGHYNNFFFAAHLLDVAMGVKTLRTILSSVTHNGKQVRWGGGHGAPGGATGNVAPGSIQTPLPFHQTPGVVLGTSRGGQGHPLDERPAEGAGECLTPFPPALYPQLAMTVGLLAVVVYLYTVVAFNFFRKFYNKSEDEDEPDMKCDDMMTVGGGWVLPLGGCWASMSPRPTAPSLLPPVLPVPHVRGGPGRRGHRGRD